MRIFPRTIAVLGMVSFCLGSISRAETFYVDPAGNDSSPGTMEQPLASLAGARDRVRILRAEKAGKSFEVLIRKGEYFLSEPLVLTEADSGAESAPLVFRGEAGARPIFYGGVRLKGFQKVSDDLWKMDSPELRRLGGSFEQLYVNGRRAIRARSPNQGFFQPLRVTETILDQGAGPVAGSAEQKVLVPAECSALLENLSPSDLNRAMAIFYHNWDNTMKPIFSYDKNEKEISIRGRGMAPWNKIQSKSLFLIENVKAALDAPGEWFLDRDGTLYYRPLPDEDIASTTCLVPVSDQFILVRGDEKSGRRSSHIRFENLSFRVAGYRMPIAGVDPAQAAAPVEAAVQLDFADHVDFIDCEIAQTGANAIWYRRACAYGRVERCELHDLGAGAVKIGETVIRPDAAELTHHTTVDNNIMRSGGHVFPCAVALIVFHGSDNNLTHNDIADFRYSAISLGWVWGYGPSPSKRNRVEFNHLHHLGWGELSDMGGVYTLGASEGTVIANNLIHHVYAFDYGGWGLYTDEGSSQIVIENNLVYACKSAAFHQHYGRDNIVRNNIFARNLLAEVEASRVEPHESFSFTHNIVYADTGTLIAKKWDQLRFFSDQNCYWDSRTKDIRLGQQSFQEWQDSGRDLHSTVADPGFVDAAAFDFRLKNGEALKAIGFKPFDPTQAGVYGSEEWKAKAKLDPAIVRAFEEMVLEHEAAGEKK